MGEEHDMRRLLENAGDIGLALVLCPLTSHLCTTMSSIITSQLRFSVRLVNATSRLPLFYMESDNYGTREVEAKSLSMDSWGKRG